MAFKKTGKIVATVGAALLLSVAAAEAIVGTQFGGIITQYLTAAARPPIENQDFKEATGASDDLCRQIGDEGIALLKNLNNALPLKGEKRINLLGWNATDAGFHFCGIGSGSSTIQESKRKTLVQAFKEEGWEVNQDILDFYYAYDHETREYGTGNSARIPLIQPFLDEQVNGTTLEDLLEDAIDFSDTALIVLSRIGGENVGEIPLNQPKLKSGHSADSTRNYLDISTEEEELINAAKDRFDHVIVLINSTNQMQLGRIADDPKVEAILNCSITGQSATFGVPHILQGYKTVKKAAAEGEEPVEVQEKFSPSGRLTDTWARDYTKSPAFVNYIRQGNNIAYTEDIYFGYRYYETAYEEALNNNFDFDYDQEVIYPFGHGLSYTSFEWAIESVNLPEGSALQANSKIELTLSCTNTGEYPGKDVIQLYATAPYIPGEIEKPARILVDFAKSGLLQPGDTQSGIKLYVDAYDMASYDCYDRNDNGHAGYELDKGDYTLTLRENAHDLKKMAEGQKNSIGYSVANIIDYYDDPTTGEAVENRFTGEEAYAGVPLDGSTAYQTAPTYLSRDDFEGTWPKSAGTSMTSAVSTANNFRDPRYEGLAMPEYDQPNDLHFTVDGQFNDELLFAIASDYDGDELEELVSQMSRQDWKNLVENGGFQTAGIASIDKPRMANYDGPAGFNTSTQGVSKGGWTAFCSETLIGQTYSKTIARQLGRSMGAEGAATPGDPLNGWYAPGVNLHRHPFNGRNYEYYSEDPILSGLLAANVIEGAKSNNLTCYLKHFTLSEPGANARNLNTWLTEQNLRENYLKPFEIAVKKGKANAMMTAFNSIGGVWAGACGAQNHEILRGEWGFHGCLLTDWSDGGGNMNTTQGLRGGNDFWLNPATHSSPLNINDAAIMNAAKFAAKNILFTVADTYSYYKNHDASLDDGQSITIGKIEKTEDQTWWIPLFISTGIVFTLGAAALLVFAWVPFKKRAA